MKEKLKAWLCILLVAACAGSAAALPEQETTAIWRSYLLLVEWAEISDEAPGGMQAEQGMRYVRVHMSALGDEVRTTDIGDHGGEIELRHETDGEIRTPEMFTSYDTVFDKGSGGIVNAETQASFDLLYRVPASWAREDIKLAIPPYTGKHLLIPLRALADGPSSDAPVAVADAQEAASTAQQLHRLTLSPSASLDFSAMDAEMERLWTQAAQYLGKVEIEASFALLEGAPYASLRLTSNGTDLGVVEGYLAGDLLYIRGDMLPEGWLTMSLRSLTAGAGGLPEAGQASGTLADMGVSFGQVFGAFSDSVEAWYAAQPEGTSLSTIGDTRDWPRYYFINAYKGQRLRMPAEAIAQVLADTDAALRALAIAGSLVDFDGTTIVGETMYEQSLVRHAVVAVQSWHGRYGLSLSMDSLEGAKNFMEVSYDLTSQNYTHSLLAMVRRLPWVGDGPQAFTGEIQRVWDGERFDAHLDIRADSAAGQYDLHADGNSGNTWSQVWFDSRLELRLPETGDAIFEGSADARVYDQDDELRVDLRADAVHNTQSSGQGGWDDCTLMLAMDAALKLAEYQEAQTLQAGLDIHYQRLEETPALHDLSDVRLHMDANTTDEDMSAYDAALETVMTGWIIKAMSTLPAELLQAVMADYM